MPDSASVSSQSRFTPRLTGGLPSRGLFIIELMLALILTRIPYLSVPFKWLEIEKTRTHYQA